MERKQPAPVRSIKGERPDLDTVTDKDYREAVEAQDLTLLAQANERRLLERIRDRLLVGAKDGGKRYYFDGDRCIVRRREPKESAS